jgi:CHAT domain-containing protein
LALKFLFTPVFLIHFPGLVLYGAPQVSDSSLAGFYVARAEILYEKSDYDSLPYYYSRALKISIGTNDTSMVIQCYLGFAEYYRLISEYGNASAYLDKAKNLLTGKMKGYADALADVYYITAKIFAGQGEYKVALKYTRMASEINGLTNPPKNARYLNFIGNIYDIYSDFDSAEYYFHESYKQINSVTNGPAIEKAWYYLNMSQIYNRRGEYDKALDYLKSNIQISIKLYGEEFPDLMNSYLNMGYYYITAGLPDTARFYLNKTENLIYNDSISGRTLIPSLYECRGILSYLEGDYPEARKAYQQALETAIQVYGPTHPILYRYYNNCANIYYTLGNYGNAIQFYHKAAKSVENLYPSGSFSSYYYLANTYSAAGQTKEADYYYNKLITGQTELLGPGHPLLGYYYLSYGDFLTSLGKLDEAKKYLESALNIRLKNLGEKHYLTSEAYMFLGRYYLKAKDYEQALNYFQKALIGVAAQFEDMDYNSNPEISENINFLMLLKILKDKARTLEHLGENNKGGSRNPEYLDASYHTYQSAVNVILRLQNDWLTEESRLYLSENENETFLALIRISLDLYELTGQYEYLATGFETAEKMKYSTLLATLRDQKALEEGKVPEDLKNLDRQTRMKLSAYNDLIVSEYKKETPDSVKIRNWNKKIYDLNSDRKELIRQLSKKYPEYYSLKYFPGIINAKSIQKKLGNNDMMAEYVLADSLLIIFNLDNSELNYRRIGIDSTFRRNIRMVYDFIRKDYFNTSSEQITTYFKAASELYKSLIGDDQLEENKRLIIIPDGMLAYIPFDILLTKPVDGADYNFGKLDYLIKKHSLSYAYSATLLFQSDYRKMRARKGLLAFAPSDPESMVKEINSLRDISLARANLKPLVGSAKEVRSIIRIVGGDLKIGNEASEFCFKQLSSKYSILHLAAHAFIDEDDPLNSKLVFSSNMEGDQDGLLNVFEIYNLNLNASMVVLSACNTGYGKLKRGEGIMSLARAFFYAGVPDVVMTLWPVGDESCGKLMTHFYKNLAKGATKDQALRNAKLSFLEEADPITQHPFYWAGYIVVGDSSAIFKSGITKFMIIGIILIIFILGFIYKKKLFRKGRE